MKFFIDTQLPPKLAKFLSEEGFDAIHSTDLQNGHLLSDKEITLLAVQQERIIVTEDSDFFDRFFIKGIPPIILFVKLGNISNNQLRLRLNSFKLSFYTCLPTNNNPRKFFLRAVRHHWSVLCWYFCFYTP
jgi:predicted nuclease of predicted toxin-antitoxin system